MKPLLIAVFYVFCIPVFGQNEYDQPATIDPTTVAPASSVAAGSNKNEILFGVLSVAGSNRINPKNDNAYLFGSGPSNSANKKYNYYSGFGVYSRIGGKVGYGETDLEGGIHREDLSISAYNVYYGNHGSCNDVYEDRFRLKQNVFEFKATFLGGVKWFSQSKRFNFETAIGFHLMFDHNLKTFIDEEEEIDSGTCIQDTTYRIGLASIKMNTDYNMKTGFTCKAGFSYKCSDHICIHFTGGARSSDRLFYFEPFEYKMELFSTFGCSYIFNPIQR